jgi:hypothetical protein
VIRRYGTSVWGGDFCKAITIREDENEFLHERVLLVVKIRRVKLQPCKRFLAGLLDFGVRSFSTLKVPA